MNKNILKLFPVTLAIAALSSCSTDDFFNDKVNNSDYKKSLALTITTPDTDEPTTRSSMVGIGNARYFNDKDEIRVYDKYLQAFDTYTFKTETEDGGNVFLPNVEDEEDLYVKKDDATYLLFPGDMVDHGSWRNGNIYALMKIGGELSYGESEPKEGNIAYLSNIPEFGLVNQESENEGLAGKTVYLTGILKIKLENGKGNVKAIRVRSLKADGTTANKDMPLWGYFDAILDNSHPMDATNKSKLVPSEESLAPEVKDENCTLVVNLDAKEMNQYTSYVYIPIIPATTRAEKDITTKKYEKLVVDYYTGTESTPNWSSTNDVKTLVTYEDMSFMTAVVYSKDKYVINESTGLYASATDSKELVIDGGPIKRSAESLAEIQKILNEAAAIGSDITVTIDVTAPISIHYSKDESTYKLKVPATLKGQRVLLDCTSSNKTGLISAGTEPDDVFEIEAAEGANGTLAIKGATIEAPIEANLGNVDLELSYDKLGVTGKSVEFTTNTLTLGDGVEMKSELNLTATNVYVDGSVTLQNNAKLSANGSVIVTENGEISAEISAANVTVDGKAAKITATNKVTVNSGATVSGEIVAGSADIFADLGANAALSATGNVAIAKDVTVNSLTLGNAEGNAIANIDITVAEEPAAAAEEAAKANPVVTALIVKKVTKVNATDITIAGITKTAQTGDTEIHTAGASEITNVLASTEGLKFTSEYDGSVAASALPSGHIYTAAQLAKLTNSFPNGQTTYLLETDVTSKTGTQWTSLNIGSNATTKNVTVTFNGNNHLIKGVSLAGDNHGLFSELVAAASDDYKVTVNVKDLNIEGVSYTGTEAVNGLGTLVGKISGAGVVNITNVKVTGTSIGTAAKESQNIGGLIGQVDGTTVNLTGSTLKLTGNILGHYNLGGTIGSVTNGANVTITTSPIVIGGFTVYNNTTLDLDDLSGEEEEHAKYGTVGMVVGSILGYTNTLTLGTQGSSAGVDLFSGNKRNTDTQRKDLHFDYNFKYNSSNGKKQWFKGGLSAVGYSPTMVEIDETTGLEKDNASKVTYLGSEYKASSINSYTTTAY